MQFIKAAWKLLVAVKDGLVLIAMLLFFSALYALLSVTPNSASVSDGALLLDLDGVIVEEKSTEPLLGQFLGGGDVVAEYSRPDLVRALDAARGDARVEAVVLDLDFFLGGGQASLSSIGDALGRVKAAGKPIYAFATFYSDDAYQLAAHADEIWVDPMGGAGFAGPGGSRLYYKQAIDQLGVTAHVYRVGTFKSAVEPYLRADQSPEAKQAIRGVYDDIWENWLAEIGKARPQAKLAAYATNPAELVEAANGDTAQLALDQGLVDKIGSRAEFEAFIAEQVGVDSSASPDSYDQIALGNYLVANPADREGSTIGVITIEGEIVSGDYRPGFAASGAIADRIHKAVEEDDLSALVVRIDSPGGSALASEEMRLALKAARDQDIPVVVSMANVAASGGYWVATESDAIFAEPDTITGSIGVFAVLPSFEGALAKWGVTADGVQTTPLSGQPDLLGGVNEEFNRIAQAGVENSYDQFLALVAGARDKSKAQVDEIGQGRVWSGGAARQLGLVDRLGGIDAALAEAAKSAKLGEGEWHARYLTPQPGYTHWLLGDGLFAQGQERLNAERGLFAWAAREQRMALGAALGTAQRLLSGQDIQALCLECTPVSPTISRDGDTSRLLQSLLSFAR